MERLLNPAILIFMIPITAILVGGIKAIVTLVIRHRERMAMIEMDELDEPDAAAKPQTLPRSP